MKKVQNERGSYSLAELCIVAVLIAIVIFGVVTALESSGEDAIEDEQFGAQEAP